MSQGLTGSKAEVLSALSGRIKHAQIADVFYFSVAQWREQRQTVLHEIIKKFPEIQVIVRSSSTLEDSSDQSNAGAFLSVLNVTTKNFNDAVNRVIESYGEASDKDHVLVQPMLKNVTISGVAFSHDPQTRSPYRVINWHEGQDTTVVTGGMGGKTWRGFKSEIVKENIPFPFAKVLGLIDELEPIFDFTPLDIEFAFTDSKSESTLWLLQARPLLIRPHEFSEQALKDILLEIENKVNEGLKPHPFLMGKRTVYGVMPDWNPAEIIGIRPKPLALSLYKELITDSIWAYQRHNYGYRNLRSFPLMPHFFGLPYIDVRVSLNSFIPADLPEDLANRLVDHYLNSLLDAPYLHDKVEFEIVFSCYTLDLPIRLESLLPHGFTQQDIVTIQDSLRALTNNIIHPEKGLWRKDANKLQILEQRRKSVLESDMSDLNKIYWLLEDAKRYGTLPFAGLARAAFIAVQLLQSLVSTEVFSESDYQNFMASISTIGSELSEDYNKLTPEAFLKKYGHLRPGTYDILSPRYDEQPDLYFDWSEKDSTKKARNKENPAFSLTVDQMRHLNGLLEKHGLYSDLVGLMDFLESSIILREKAKFLFTRNLSDALQLIDRYGQSLKIGSDDIAYCDIDIFYKLQSAALLGESELRESIQLGKKAHKLGQCLRLPPLISNRQDVWQYSSHENLPNFVTQKNVTAQVTFESQKESLTGRIVCIPNADPGYDWLFSHNIAGLITAWGGTNSHMAIRASEMGLPAVIGVGEENYRLWSNAKMLNIDCQTNKVEIVL